MSQRQQLVFVLLFTSIRGATSADQAELLARITVRNALNEPLTQAGVSLPLRSEWKECKYLWLQREQFAIPCQVDDLDGDRKPDELFFQVDLPADGGIALSLWTVDQPIDSRRRVCAFVQESAALVRPVWESELLGFFGYGPATLGVVGKMKPGLTGERLFGPTEATVQDADVQGLDFLPVGVTLGAGGLFLSEYLGDRARMTRPWTANSIRQRELNRPYHDAEFEFEVLADGPIRAILQSRIKNWGTARGQYELRLLYLIEAGKRHCEVRAELRRVATRARRLRIGAGFAQFPEEKEFDYSDSWMCAVAWEAGDAGPAPVAANLRGLALWWEEGAFDTLLFTPQDGGNHAVILTPDGSRKVRFWHAAAWDQDGGITSARQWREYVDETSRQLASPPVLVVDDP